MKPRLVFDEDEFSSTEVRRLRDQLEGIEFERNMNKRHEQERAEAENLRKEIKRLGHKPCA